MPHKFNVLTQNIHTLRLSVGGHTHGCTENIYSIFRDKLLLLGEHVYALEIIYIKRINNTVVDAI